MDAEGFPEYVHINLKLAGLGPPIPGGRMDTLMEDEEAAREFFRKRREIASDFFAKRLTRLRLTLYEAFLEFHDIYKVADKFAGPCNEEHGERMNARWTEVPGGWNLFVPHGEAPGFGATRD